VRDADPSPIHGERSADLLTGGEVGGEALGERLEALLDTPAGGVGSRAREGGPHLVEIRRR
jgi:hypothetical protein